MRGYYPDPDTVAKRNLTERIQRFQPVTGYERAQVSRAIDALQDKRYPDGEDHMLRAERSDLYDPSVV